MGRNVSDFTYGVANKAAMAVASRLPRNSLKNPNARMEDADIDRQEIMDKVSNSRIGNALGWNKK